MARSDTAAAALPAWPLAAGLLAADTDADAAGLGAAALEVAVLEPLEHAATSKPITAALAALII